MRIKPEDTSPAMQRLLIDLQHVLDDHDANICGTFALHTRYSIEESEHRRIDGPSLYHLSSIDGDEIEKWK